MFQEEVAARGKQVTNITIDLAEWINLTLSPTTPHDTQELDVLVTEMKTSACKYIQSSIHSYTMAFFTRTFNSLYSVFLNSGKFQKN
jgi:hypothetical protein